MGVENNRKNGFDGMDACMHRGTNIAMRVEGATLWWKCLKSERLRAKRCDSGRVEGAKLGYRFNNESRA